MIVLKQIFHEAGPKTKSRQKVVHDIKKVEKHWAREYINLVLTLETFLNQKV